MSGEPSLATRRNGLAIERPRAVFFDMGGTLVYPYPSFHGLIARVCCAHGLDVTEQEIARAEPAVWERIAQREGGARGFTTDPERSRSFWLWVYETFLEQVGCTGPRAAELAAQLYSTFIRSESYRLYDDALPALERIRRAGLMVGVISNWESWLERLMIDLGIRHYVDVAAISGVTGSEKPAREIFLHALTAAKVAPSEALHVGDNIRDDVEGAEAVGIRGVLVHRTGGRPAYFGPSPAPTAKLIVSSLLEIPDLLGLP